MLSNLWNDVRYAARTLSRDLGFTAAAIVTIALGIGVNTGIFSVLNDVLFRALPVPDAHELVSIYQTIEGAPDREGGISFGRFSTAEYRIYRDRSETLSGIVGFSDPWSGTLGGDVPQEIVGALVTCNYFGVLRQPPEIGRGLTARDCEAGGDPVLVLGHALWTATFGGDPEIVGRTVELNRRSFTVVGVASEGTGDDLSGTAFFAPISTQPLLLPDENLYENEQNSWLFMMGRRAERADIDQVRAESSVIAAQIDRQQPGRSTTLLIDRATPLSIPLFRDSALRIGAVVMTAFGLVLLIACANVANLLLARATTRSREIALRVSLGASRARVFQQLMVESLLISVAGGILGSALAMWSFQALGVFALPPIPILGIPSVFDTSPDMRVLSFAVTLTLATGVVFGLVPALHASKADLQSMMKLDPSGVVGALRGGGLQGVLVGVQVALCMMLMIGTGLLVRGLYAAQSVDPGFAYGDVAVAAFDLEAAGYDSPRAAVFRRQLMDRVRALPGVDVTAYARREPLSTQMTDAPIRLPDEADDQLRRAERNEVTSDYFRLVGIPIVRGRTFTDTEIAEDSLVAIVTETTARNLWPGEESVGRTLVAGAGFEFRVVGVAADAQVTRLGEVDSYYLYLPATPRVATGQLELLVRGRDDFAATASGIRAAAAALDPGVAVAISPLEANLDRWRDLSGSVTALGASLGMLALVLSAVGIYGVVSYFVSRRYREIGIRMALGAKSRNLLALILRRTTGPVIVGAVVGLGAALAASDILSAVLFGVGRADLLALGGSALFVLGTVLAVALLAGRSAVWAEPAKTLRYE